MAYGMEIVDNSGKIWLSPDVTPLNLVQKVTQVFTSGQTYAINTNVPAGNAFMFFAKVDRGAFGVLQQQVNGVWQITVTAVGGEGGASQNITATFYIFSNYVTNVSRYTIAYYDASGVMRWHGDMRPLQVFQGSVGDTSGGAVDLGVPCAVSPYFSSLYLGLYTPGTPPIYQFFQTAWRARDNVVSSYPVNTIQTTSPAYTPYSINGFYYIKTAFYDM